MVVAGISGLSLSRARVLLFCSLSTSDPLLFSSLIPAESDAELLRFLFLSFLGAGSGEGLRETEGEGVTFFRLLLFSFLAFFGFLLLELGRVSDGPYSSNGLGLRLSDLSFRRELLDFLGGGLGEGE